MAKERQIAVITGASSGIGRAIALAWSARGEDAWLLGRDANRLENVALHMQGPTAKSCCITVDLEDEISIRDVCRKISSETDHIDLLVHCAGAVFLGPVAEAPVEKLDQQYWVNLRAPYLMTQLLLPSIRSAQGQIVFVNSSAGLRAASEFSQYSATKHALKALADSLRQEVNLQGIRVISVYPGRTASPMQEAVCSMENRLYRPERLLNPEDVAVAVLNAIGLPRNAEITDLQIRPMLKP